MVPKNSAIYTYSSIGKVNSIKIILGQCLGSPFDTNFNGYTPLMMSSNIQEIKVEPQLNYSNTLFIIEI